MRGGGIDEIVSIVIVFVIIVVGRRSCDLISHFSTPPRASEPHNEQLIRQHATTTTTDVGGMFSRTHTVDAVNDRHVGLQLRYSHKIPINRRPMADVNLSGRRDEIAGKSTDYTAI